MTAAIARTPAIRLDVVDPDPAAARVAAEELAEQIAEVEHTRAAALRAVHTTREAAGEALVHTGVRADLVVQRALLAVAEHVVRVRDVLEPRLLGLVAARRIGVIRLGELAIGALDVVRACALADTQRLVVVDARIEVDLLRHGYAAAPLVMR